jgi:hypothetical protein
VWERINIGVFLLWVVVLATMLLTARDTAAVTGVTYLSGRTVPRNRHPRLSLVHLRSRAARSRAEVRVQPEERSACAR